MNPEKREFELRDYAIILMRRKWWVILAFLVTTTSAAIYTLSREPIYEASARILISTERKTAAAGAEGGAAATLLEAQDVETQLEILRSPGLFRTAIDTLPEEAKPARVAGVSIDQVKKTNIVSISIRSPKPQTAAAIANALGDAYIARSLELNKRATKQALQYVGEQISVAQHELDDAESALRIYRERTGIMEAETSVTGQAGKVANTEGEVTKLGVELRATEAELAQVDKQRRQVNPTILSEREQNANPVVQELKSRLMALEIQRLQLLDQYTEGSRKIKQTDAQIDVLKQRLQQEVERVITGEVEAANPLVEQLDKQKSTLEAQRIALQARQAALSSTLPAENAKLAVIPARQVEFSRLSRRVKVAETSYMNLLSKQQELLIAQGSEVANAAIASLAAAPGIPVGPRVQQNLLVAAIMGLLLGLVLAVAVDYLDDSIKDPKEAETILGAPVIGLIGYAGEEGPLLVDNPTSRSPLAEAFRTLRANLRFSAADKPVKTLLVTSAGVGEGKSTIATDLAIAATTAGQKVILVDTDLRRPSLHRFFEIDGGPGLTNVLIGDGSLEEALRPVEGLDIALVTSGPLPPNPIELLESQAMVQTVAALRERADLVIFDSAPLLVVADSQILSSLVDGTLVVVEINVSRREMARQAKELLARANARVLGLVVNKLRRVAGGYYYYYYSYGYYYGGSREDEDASAKDVASS